MLAFCLCGYRLMAKLTAFQAVAMGSSPITRTLLDLGPSGKGGVTQLVRVLACHARSRGFESHVNGHDGVEGLEGRCRRTT